MVNNFSVLNRVLFVILFPLLREKIRNMSRIRKNRAWLLLVVLAALSVTADAQTNGSASTNLFTHPLSRVEAVEMALRQNSTILKGRADLRASYGIEIQLRSVALPRNSPRGGRRYNAEGDSLIESFPSPRRSVRISSSRIKIGTPMSKSNRRFTRAVGCPRHFARPN